MKRCTLCGKEKSDSEFYKTRLTNGYGPSSICKECAKYRSAVNPGNEPRSTQEVRFMLNQIGIPVTTGKQAGFPKVDLAAWGCVPIEAKGSKEYVERGGKFHFQFTIGQRENGWIDGLLLVCICMYEGNRRRVFVVPGDNELVNGKTAFSFIPDSCHRLSNWDKIRCFENAFHLIEIARIKASSKLIERSNIL